MENKIFVWKNPEKIGIKFLYGKIWDKFQEKLFVRKYWKLIHNENFCKERKKICT